MKKLTCCLYIISSFFALSSLAQADAIGVKASSSAWQVSTQSAQESLATQTTPMLSLAVEHPIPLLPNAKLRYLSLNQNRFSNNNLQQIRLQQSDAILYYELLNHIVQLDAGLAASELHGEQQRQQQHEKISQTRPTAYVSVAAKLPFTGFSAHTEALYGNSFGTRLRDMQVEIQYDVIDHLLLNVGAKMGYRSLNVEFSQDRLTGPRLKFAGPYIGVDLHF